MTRIFENISDEKAAKLIQKAAKNIMGRFYEETKIDQSVIEIIADALSLSINGLKDCEIDYKERSNPYKCKIIKRMIEFSHKAKLTYGIVDPTEAFLIWLAIIKGESINDLVSRSINPEFTIILADSCRKNKEYEFLDAPKEETQKSMSGLSIVDCALVRAITGIDDDIENTINGVLGDKIKDIFSRSDYAHFCLVDSAVSMSKYMNHPIGRTVVSQKSKLRFSYAAGIILEIFRNSSNNDIFIRFFDNFTKSFEDMVVYEKTIKTDADKRQFWMSFSPSIFKSYTPNIGVLIKKFLKSKDYLSQKNNKRVSLTLITDGSALTGSGIRVAREVNVEDVKLNMILLYDIDDVNAPELFKMVSHVRDKNLFAFRNGNLVDLTDGF